MRVVPGSLARRVEAHLRQGACSFPALRDAIGASPRGLAMALRHLMLRGEVVKSGERRHYMYQLRDCPDDLPSHQPDHGAMRASSVWDYADKCLIQQQLSARASSPRPAGQSRSSSRPAG